MFTKQSIVCSLLLASIYAYNEPNPPSWDTSKVKVIEAGQDAQSLIDQIYSEMGGTNPPENGQFSDSRYALFFKPGSHDLDVRVGFYTQALGLGRTPTDTSIRNLRVDNADPSYVTGALCVFWRGAENLKVDDTWGAVTWAVSQACPLRRTHIEGDLHLWQHNADQPKKGYASGGFMADNYISGAVVMSDAQEAFSLRNINMKYYGFGNWNFVHIGNAGDGVPQDHCPAYNWWRDSPNTVIDETPTIREKPYIIFENGKYKLMKPRTEFNKKDHTENWENADEIDFEDVYVANENDSVNTLNSKLGEGLHLVLQPGNYKLDEPLQIIKPGTVVLGLGLATLISTNGNAVIEVGDIDGVTVSGLIIQAGEKRSSTLLKWGTGSHAGSVNDPGVMHDIFARVGGPNDSRYTSVQTDSMVEVNSGNVIIDNAWLWRADHDIGGNVYNQANPVNNALVVNGDHVTAYGLAGEHTLEHIVDWHGDHGATYFYQAELLYDNDWTWKNGDYVGYNVDESVNNHLGYGVSVYSYLRDLDVTASSAIKAPEKSGVYFKTASAIFMNGNGGFDHVINQSGAAANTNDRLSYQCSWNGQENATPEFFLQ